MASPTSPVELALQRWRNNLIDLTRRNPLLSLKATRSGYLEVSQPDLPAIYEAVVGRKPWLFFLPPEPEKEKPKKNGGAKKEPLAPKPNELLTQETDRTKLLATLTNLFRRAQTDYRERGLHILHLALGILDWQDNDGEAIRSPLLLLPVKLERHSLRDPFMLKGIDDEDPLVNPALTARLKQDFDFKLPEAPADWAEKTPTQYLDEVQAAVQGLPGWQVHRSVVLSTFSFFKGVIFQDLQDNAQSLGSHPVVQLLAGVPTTLPRVPVMNEKEIDDQIDAEQACHILDADGSQRLCLDAAAKGENFVLIGPPGTGKSQTIANLIADQIAHGKKVLFVSDKMAALEVVYQRLKNAGLGDFCLELHSHKANKREVIYELARCFLDVPKPGAVPSTDDFAKLKNRRDKLNRYVRALHLVREPMKKSAWDALAELPRWQDLPQLPLGLPSQRVGADANAKLVLAEFTAAHFDELQQHLRKLQNLWHVRSQPGFPWRGFKADRYSLQLRDEVIGAIDRVRQRGDKLKAASDAYAQSLGVAGSVNDLVKLGDLLDKHPPQPSADWLRARDLPDVEADLNRCAEVCKLLGEARKPLTERYGTALWKQPPGSAAKIEQAWRDAMPLFADGDERGVGFLKLHAKLRAWAAETQKRVPSWTSDLRAIEKWLQLPLPVGLHSTASTAANESKLDPSLEGFQWYLKIATLAQSDGPEPAWLGDRAKLQAVVAHVTQAKPLFLRYRSGRQTLLRTYSEGFFDLDLPRIAEGYAGPYQRWWCIFRSRYRRDRWAIARCTPNEVVPKTVVGDTALGRDVQLAKRQLESDTAQRRDLIGRYEKGLDSDIEAAERAARHAVEIVELASQLGHDALPTKTIEVLAAASAPEKVRASLKRLNESFVVWNNLTHELQAYLPWQRLPGAGEPFEECALSAIVEYAKQVLAKLNPFAGLADPVLTATPPADMAAFVADLKQAEDLLTAEAAQQTEAPRWLARFGPAFKGIDTDWDSLRKTLNWTKRVRECLGAMQVPPATLPIANEGFIALATGTPPSTRELRSTLEQYQHALHTLELRYDAPGPVLDGKPLRDLPIETVLDHLKTLRDRVGELSDWIDWRYLPERFQHLGLKSFWDQLQHHDIAKEQVVSLFQKSYWTSWLDMVFQQDSVLRDFRRAEHEQTIAEFRELDRKLLREGSGRIVQRVVEGRTFGEGDPLVALLMKEAHKKAKHLPLRQLFDTMPALVQELKPCLLMSPLSVSQFLPGDVAKMSFDLVVFDEASQLLPEDAVGAIHRGRQLIVTGDNQQLPPTTFFQQNAGEGENDTEADDMPLYESVLDACLGAGVPRKMLRWHYRSRHEHLIAFSNETYYESRLFTFPAALSNNPLLGVKFHHVADGVYDRGGKRDNPREADVVAQLVLKHFKDHPEKTLGVIAFSYAQMDAIENAIERALAEQPDLERFFQGDRLEGFFVKNLETVQGDERDVILLSVGYGRDSDGKITLNFGPLNREGGQRRLNVAVTRARQMLTVVSSIRARELNLSPDQALGLVHLQKYLDFAERGVSALGLGRPTPPSAMHGLQADVLGELKKLGYDAVCDVGCGANRVDLGVHLPGQPGTFVLGIEFDGPDYDETGTARDRDRLRPEVLEKLGWKLHPIWSPDWVFRKQEEIARLKAALAASRG